MVSSVSSVLSAAVSFCSALPAGARVAIVGSRGFAPLELVSEFVGQLPASCIVVSGAAKGVDSAAAAAARSRGLKVVEFSANWKRGKSAGMQRNKDIVAAAIVLIAFWDGSSRGTAHSISLARRSGIPCFVISPAAAPAAQLSLF